MKWPFQILVILLLGNLSVSAVENYRAGARSIALSNASVSLSYVWSTFHNQATLSGLETLSAGVFYESKYMVDELSLAAGTFSLPAANGAVGFSFYQLGKGTYKESKIGLAYSKRLSQRLNAAVQMDYFSSRFPENEKAFGFTTFEAGISFQTTRHLTLGLHVFNPIKNGMETRFGKESMQAILRFGGHYLFSDQALIAFEIEKSTDFAPIIKTGLEFYLINNLALRFGVSGRPVQISSGLGYSFGKFTTDIAFSYHGNLGFTPSVSVNVKL